MKRIHVFICLILFNAQFGCEEENICFRAAGDVVTEKIPLPEFSGLSLYDNADVVIVPSADQSVEIQFGKNLIGELELSVEDGELQVRNRLRCNWTHSFSKPVVFINTPSLNFIGHYGSGKIQFADTLDVESLAIEIVDASGDLDLTVNANTISLTTNGTSNVTLNGVATYFYHGSYWNNGRLYAADLRCDLIELYHFGYNDLYLHAVGEITGTIENSGNAYYRGEPKTTVEEKWTGRLKRLK